MSTNYTFSIDKTHTTINTPQGISMSFPGTDVKALIRHIIAGNLEIHQIYARLYALQAVIQCLDPDAVMPTTNTAVQIHKTTATSQSPHIHMPKSIPPGSIPRLAPNLTLQDITLYLKWLADSPLQYHLDDDPREIEAFSYEQQLILQENMLLIRQHPSITPDLLWSLYPVPPETNP